MRNPYGMLSDRDIVAAVERHRKWALSKFRPSYGQRFWRWRNRDKPRIFISDFDPTPSNATGGNLNPNSYNLHLGPELLFYASPYLDSRQANPTRSFKIPPEGHLLEPGVLYLGMTDEYTQTFRAVPRIDGRSSIGRLGCCVHLTAGFGDVGFEGRFVLEITVVHPLRVYAGMSLCQISYSTIGPGSNYQGKYQKRTGITPSELYRESVPVNSETI